MRNFVQRLAFLTPAFAMVAGGGTANAGGNEPERALALNVSESGDSVEIQLIAQSAVTQQVDYQIELIGNSRARHSGNTSIPAGDRQILSRLTTNVSDTWCARVEVTEGSGASYTLTAGDCS
jgi:hypothetical protein